jgi:hypothetical protein
MDILHIEKKGPFNEYMGEILHTQAQQKYSTIE